VKPKAEDHSTSPQGSHELQSMGTEKKRFNGKQGAATRPNDDISTEEES
jgi:hypothetical protein